MPNAPEYTLNRLLTKPFFTKRRISGRGHRADYIVLPSGSAATHAGLLFGLRALGSPIKVIGACVRRGAQLQGPRVESLVHAIAELLEMDCPVAPEDEIVNATAFGE